MQSYGGSYVCLLNVIFGCVNRNFDTIFDPVLPEPNRIFGLLNLSNEFPARSIAEVIIIISNFPGAQGSLSKVDSNTLMIRKVQKEHVPETESDCKTRSSFRALFYRVSRAFGCNQNVHVALVTRGARRSTRNLPCHDYPLVCSCFFRHWVSFTFSKPLLQKLFVHPPI